MINSADWVTNTSMLSWSNSSREAATDIVAPDGTNTATKITNTFADNTGANKGLITQKVTGITGSGNVTYSVFVKAGNKAFVDIRTFLSSTGNNSGNTTYAVDFNNDTPQYTIAGGSVQVKNKQVIPYPNGWKRYIVTLTNFNSATEGSIRIYGSGYYEVHPQNSDFVRDIGDYVYVWGAQIEQGSYASSYIPTSGSTVTRAADTYTSTATTVLDRDGGNKEAFYNIEAGTGYFEGGVNNFNYGTAYEFNHNNLVGFRQYMRINDSNNIFHFGGGDSGLQFNYGISNETFFDKPSKHACAYALNSTNAAANGVLDTTNDTTVVPYTNTSTNRHSALYIGARATGDSAVNEGIARLTFWKTRLPDATLINIPNT
jgi:hypothetical protein